MGKIILQIAESHSDEIYGFYINGKLHEQCEYTGGAYHTLIDILENNNVAYFNKAEICSEWFDEVGEATNYTLPEKFSDIEDWLV